MSLLIIAVALAIVYLLVLFVVLVAYTLTKARRRKPPADANVILVLGAPVHYGRVLPLLARRLDTALRLWREAATDPVIVVSGGRPTSSSSGTEAAAMARYLIEAGLPADRVVTEEQSGTTRENIRYSKELEALTGAVALHRNSAPADGEHAAVALVVTSDFHVLRTTSICRRHRLRATVVGAVSPSGGLRRTMVREFGMLLGEWWPLHVVAVAGITAVLVALGRG